VQHLAADLHAAPLLVGLQLAVLPALAEPLERRRVGILVAVFPWYSVRGADGKRRERTTPHITESHL
jgi:hypothetical protein